MQKEFLQGFGLSVFESLYTSIMNAEISPDLMVNLIAQSNQDVYKIKELNEAVASNQDDDKHAILKCKIVFLHVHR